MTDEEFEKLYHKQAESQTKRIKTDSKWEDKPDD